MAMEKTVTVPEGVQVQMKETLLTITGPKGTLQRDVRYPQVSVTVDADTIVVRTEASRKQIVAMVGTLAAHIRNMCKGVTEGFEYNMKVVFAHFPIQLKLQGNMLIIDNFLGEKQSRKARIEEGVTAKVSNDEITLTGINKESVGNSAAHIEHATKIRNRDPRVFQDGIYIVGKA
ncbi:50S ribosomal protein L6 [Methanosphaerula subterraneus]|jgi:large subunit ribosomal protein L6|uniref:50S ribosomal protein L6 n=1 Tax=Methanosphaerula subterraneus TaxID=3350244 RepID=UPI003F832948